MKIQDDLLPDDSLHEGIGKMDFANWYVLSTQSGREMQIEEDIRNLTENRYRLFLPRREIFHMFKGDRRKVVRPLFPGYIFIYKEIESILDTVRDSPLAGMFRPIQFDDSFATVEASEMALLMNITGPTGLFKSSQAELCADRTVVIRSGPLKDLTGSIIYINKRKHKAMLKVQLLNRSMRVAVGVEVVSPD